MTTVAGVKAIIVLIIKFLTPENASHGWALVPASVIIILQSLLNSINSYLYFPKLFYSKAFYTHK